MVSFPPVSPPEPCAHLSPPPYAPHAPPISFFSIIDGGICLLDFRLPPRCKLRLRSSGILGCVKSEKSADIIAFTVKTVRWIWRTVAVLWAHKFREDHSLGMEKQVHFVVGNCTECLNGIRHVRCQRQGDECHLPEPQKRHWQSH